jgi:CubicO group peptidase (beta-lactamase class C family)
MPSATTMFGIGSVTKTVTATLLASAVHAGALRLSDAVNSSLPSAYQFPSGSPKLAITFEELAVHTSGFPRNPDNVGTATTYSIDQMYADADTIRLMSTPGTVDTYSNLGYSLLGFALANHAASTFGALAASVVTGPLAMTDTDVYAALNSTQLTHVATGYMATGCAQPPCPVDPAIGLTTFPTPALNPAGGLFASGHDMMTWLNYNLGRTGPPALVALLPLLRAKRVNLTNKSIGLAWNIVSGTFRGGTHDEVFKPGDVDGFHAYVAYVPDLGLGVFVLVNFFLPPATDAETIGDEILHALP